jgi:Prasinovirus NTPase/helicase
MAKKKEECSICAEPKTKFVTCRCGHSACTDCTERFLLESTDACCMKCKLRWDDAFLGQSTLTKKFLGTTYKEHKEKLLFDMEQAWMPETQAELEREKKMLRLDEKRRALQQKLFAIHRRIAHHRGHQERKEFVRACPANGCRGFLSTQWKCGLCETKACSKCHEILKTDEEHVCNQDNVKSAALINQQTKTCPSCGALISRISGCDQMWCTQCHTAFNWATGRKINEIVHNPHYYEWLQQNRGEAAQANMEPEECHANQLPLLRFVLRRFGHNTKVTRIHRLLLHHTHVTVHQLRRFLPAYNGNNDLRRRYLKGLIDRSRFARLIHQRYKRGIRSRAFLEIIETFIAGGTDIFNRGLALESKYEARKLIEKEFAALTAYVETHLVKVSETYKCKIPVCIRGHLHIS